MARTSSRRHATLPVGLRLLRLPIVLIVAIAGWCLRALFSVRVVRVAAYAIATALAVLLAEGAALKIVLPTASQAAYAAILLAGYAVTLAMLSWFALWLAGRRRLRVRRFESLLVLTPTQFEREVGRLLHDLGYRDVEHVGGSGDLAADLRCRDRAGRLVVVQCKRYAPGRRVGSADLQAFIGMIAVHHRADRGIYVTTAEFTRPAVLLAREHAIELYDGPRLSRLVREVAADSWP